jgi:amino acid transporter
MIAFSRVMMTVLFAGICFLLIVPLALQRHNTGVAIAVVAVFVAYLVANIVIWQRVKHRS